MGSLVRSKVSQTAGTRAMYYSPNQVPLRRLVYAILTALAAGYLAGRILSSVPTMSDNDSSRWDTVRALVDNGSYAIGQRDIDPVTWKYQDRGIVTEEGWKTIDRILLEERGGAFYSSKPPLLPTLAAGGYWLLKRTLGWSIVDQRILVERVILFTLNWLPFVIYLIVLARLFDWQGRTDWGRLYALAAGAFATFLTPFAITFNNHSVATCSALFALYPSLRVWYGKERSSHLFLIAGFFAGFTACNELPAALMLLVLGAILLVRAPARTVLLFVPAAALPVAAFLWTNYLALGRLEPAYSEVGGRWYKFEGSFWQEPAPGEVKHGIDWARLYEGKDAYAFNFVVGHHGLFSLSPIWLLALAGIAYCLLPGKREVIDDGQAGEAPEPPAPWPPRLVAGMTLVLSVVVILFYILKSDNYGGWTSGPRWLMWLTPFWLVSLLPMADWLSSRRAGRGLAYVLLAFSVLSVSYAASNPWRHPWLYAFLDWLGRIPY
jgi:hypothetical protein